MITFDELQFNLSYTVPTLLIKVSLFNLTALELCFQEYLYRI